MSDIRWQEDVARGGSARSPLHRAASSSRRPRSAARRSRRRRTARRAGARGVAQRPRRGGRLRVGHVGAGKSESFNPGRGSNFIDAVPLLQPLRPARAGSPRSHAAPRASRSSGSRTRTRPVWLIRLRRTSPSTTASRLHGRRRHLHARARWATRSTSVTRSVSGIRLGDAEEGRSAHRARSAEVAERAALRQLQRPEQRRHPGRAEGLLEAGRHRPLRVQVVHARASAASASATANYWENGKPYVDEWEDISIDDPAARLNALLAGEIDMMSQLDPRQARVAALAQGRSSCSNAPSTTIQVFSMAVDLAPFNDKRVRQAFRLIADRQALINGALAGFAHSGERPARDAACPTGSHAPVRKRDPERAKFLLKQAGQEDLAVTLQTSNVVPGFIEAATLFAQQAKAAGVDVKVKKESATAYFDTSLLYTKMAFAQSFWTVTALGAVVPAVAPLERSLERDALAAEVVRQADPVGDRRTERRARAEALARGAGDPVPRRRLHRLGEHQPRRRGRQEGSRGEAELVLQPRWLELPGRLADLSDMSSASAAAGAARRPRGHPLLRFVVLRVLAGLATLLVVSALVFLGTEVLPGDAASAVLGRTATPEQLAELRAADGARPPCGRALPRLARRPRHRRPRQLGRRASPRGARGRSGTRSRTRSSTR